MSSNIGNDILNAMGASTFDVASTAQILAEADVSARRANLEASETKYNRSLSGFDTLEYAFNYFNEQVASLTDIANFQKKTANSSDSTVIDTTITGKPNNGLYQVEVQSLATSHTLASQTEFASSTTVVGQGDLVFNVGGATSTITIDATNNSLTGIQNAVNSAGIGVNASIVNVGTGYKLMFSATNSGTGNSIDVSVTGDTDANDTDALGLSRLITANMDETVAAQDATVVVNGLTINSASNNLENVIEGVTLNLKSSDIGSIKTIEISEDTEGLQQSVEDFVELFNALDEIIDELGSYETVDEEDEDSILGNLKGDSTLRTVKSDIRQAMIDAVPGLSGSIQSLADIGITSEIDGTLSLDTSKLSASISNNPEAVGKLFAASATFTDNLVTFTGSSEDTVEGTFNLTVNTAATKSEIIGGAVGGAGITIDGTNNTFKLKVNDQESLDLTLSAGVYTEADLAKEIARVVNNDANISADGSSVSVAYDSGSQTFTMVSEKFGSASKLELMSGNFLTSGVAGFGVTAETVGQDVQGFLEKDGTLYTFVGEGQDVKISSILDGSPKGLEFTIEGGSTGARGSVEFNRGYADRLGLLFEQFLDEDSGIIGSRVSNLTDRLEEIEEKKTIVEERYEALELKYRLEFGALQTLLSNMESTRESLAASLAISTD
jgi:flagellar hook-associated protein 2